MSIYSGFPTRDAETNYNKLLSRLFTTMQEHILELSKGHISPNYSTKYTKIIAKMLSFEEHKYLPPKFTTLLKPLEDSIRESLSNAIDDFKTKDGSKSELNDLPHRLEAVKEEEELPSSRYDRVKMNKEEEMGLNRITNKKAKLKERGFLLSESSVRQYEKKQEFRSYSVFSEKSPLSEVEQLKKNERIKAGGTMTNFGNKRVIREIGIKSQERRNESQNKTSEHDHYDENRKSELRKKGGLMKAMTEAVHKKE